MVFSIYGEEMAKSSGLRNIMEDIATTIDRRNNGSPDAGGAARNGQHEWLNLSIGNPAFIPEVAATWKDLASQSIEADFEASCCSYGPSRGYHALVEGIAAYFNDKYRWSITPANVVVGPGCQMLCFVAATLFSGPRKNGRHSPIVLPIVPEYTGYDGLNMNRGNIVGIRPRVHLKGERHFTYEIDEERLESQRRVGMFLLSSPCNPTGRAITAGELDRVVAVAEREHVPVLVDNAYGEPFPRIADSQTSPRWHPNVINCFSMSKAGMPGARIGFAIGASEYIDAMTSFIANSTLHAAQISQVFLHRALQSGSLDRLAIDVLNPYYKRAFEFVEALILETFPQGLDWRIYACNGGMFCWLWIDHPAFDDVAFYERMKERRVFVVPGRHFFFGATERWGHTTRCIRLSLSADRATLVNGISKVGAALGEMLHGRAG